MNFTIKTKIIAIILFAVLALLINTFHNLTAQKADVDIVQTMYQDRIIPLKDLKTIADLYAVNIVDTTHKLNARTISYDSALASFSQARQTIKDLWQAYKGTVLVAEEEKLIAEIEPLMQSAEPKLDELTRIIKASRNSDGDCACEALDHFARTQLYPTIDPLSEKFSLLIDIQLIVAAKDYESLDQAYHNSLVFALILIVLALLLLSGLGYFIVQSINRSTSSLNNALYQLSQGQLATPIRLLGNDELTQSTRALIQFRESLQDTFRQAQGCTQSFAAGDFGHTMNETLPGDFGHLAKQLNTSFSVSESAVKTMASALNAVLDGKTYEQWADRHQHYSGEWQITIETAAQVLQGREQLFHEINQAMLAMIEGNFNHHITADMKGVYNTLKQATENMSQQLQQVIQDVTQQAQSLSLGDLTYQNQRSYPGAWGLLIQTLNESVAKLNHSFCQIAQQSQEVAASAKQVAEGNDYLSQGIQEQAASLEQTAAAMEELNGQVQHTAAQTQQTATLSGHAHASVVNSSQVMREAMHAMHKIKDSSEHIISIVGLIDGIAFQTNLLALNAAVEAARAGEHGRGFAVVASEVRALAGKASEAASNIKQLIEQTNDSILIGTEKVEDTNRSLQKVIDAVDQINSLVGSVASNTGEQAKGLAQMHEAITTIDQTVQQSAAQVEENASLAEMLGGIAQQLDSTLLNFKTANCPKTQKAALKNLKTQPSAQSGKSQQTKTLALPKPKNSLSNEWQDF